MPAARIVLGLDGSPGADAAAQWCAPIRDVGVSCDARLVDGEPAPTIMELADEVGATLVVVGRRGRGGLAELVLGSVPRRLTHHCEHPVLVVPAP